MGEAGVSEPEVSNLLTVAEAIAVIDGEKVEPRVVEVPLVNADGLVLAEDVLADRDYPPFDKSQMDGFAVRCEDVGEGSGFGVQDSGWELKVVGEIAAGQWPEREVGRGEALAIMTGAPMPIGADGVVPVEDTAELRSGARNPKSEIRTIRIQRAGVVGRYIAKRGSDVKEGTVVLEKGQRLGPAQMAVAASVGKSRVKCFAKPRVAVIGTGDELVGVDEVPGKGQIRNSNNVMLVSLLKRLGCEVRDLGVVRDEPEKIRAVMEEGMKSDVVFVTGGMSMGEYDYVPRILGEMGVESRIEKLKIKPGKPFVFGVRQIDNKFVFGLPGNPLSGFVCVVRLASRLIERLSGARVTERWVQGKLEKDLGENGPREFYQPVVVEDGVVKVLGWKGSADLYSLAKANGLLVRGENEGGRKAGEVVRVLEVPG
jgi:molybdopterin molybdotransferase